MKTFEQFNDLDPWGEEDWSEKKRLNYTSYTYFEGDNIYDWMIDMGIEKKDVDDLENSFNLFKKMYKKFNINGFNEILYPAIAKIKDKYDMDENDFNGFVGGLILNGIKDMK